MATRTPRPRQASERPPSESTEEEVKEEQAWRRECIGTNIRNARTGAGLSQRRLARRAGISDGYLSDVERGRRAVSSDFLVRVAYYLDVPVESLFSELNIVDSR
jgi:ribosome-binding protein aMBF1 (putative translation factor)